MHNQFSVCSIAGSLNQYQGLRGATQRHDLHIEMFRPSGVVLEVVMPIYIIFKKRFADPVKPVEIRADVVHNACVG